MAELAIKGHKTRGKEVIELLEMLGGENKAQLKGIDTTLVYYIYSEGYSEGHIGTLYSYSASDKHYKVFTLEEFLEEFPYKIGDEVQHKGATSCGPIFEVENMRWDKDTVKYALCLFGRNDIRSTLPAEHLQPYKEASMYLNEQANKKAEEIAEILEPVKKIMEEIKLDIPDGYEFFGIDDDNKIVLTKKQSQYPKTYEECCKIIGAESNRHYQYTKKDKEIDYPHEVKLLDCLDNLRRLLICLHAYWKIADEQMGLGKSWEPDWKKHDKKYIISVFKDTIIYFENETYDSNTILAFPTAEMRDAFYKNFKDLIELCKELL